LAIGGITPVAPDGVFVPNWYAAGGVNLTLPVFTGFRIDAQTQEARLREKAAEKQAQELSDTIARDVRVALLNAQTAFRRIAVADQFRQQTAQALALAQTQIQARSQLYCRTQPGPTAKHSGGCRGSQRAIRLSIVSTITGVCAWPASAVTLNIHQATSTVTKPTL
jgi:hypothetical protein